ncbi:MAG: LacI family DNA-binding transcriptional regulator [Burkholderia sp.]
MGPLAREPQPEAGTGKTSMSRYLNGETNVLSADLRTRIEATIQRLNYRPNQMACEMACGLKRGRNRLLGLLAADLTTPLIRSRCCRASRRTATRSARARMR